MNKKRIHFIDLAKGFAILLVIIGHIETIPYVKHLIYSFHMPLFFILSGYFFKNEESFRIAFKKLFSNLIIPYLIVGGIMRVYAMTENALNGLPFSWDDLLSLPFVLWKWKGDVVSAGAIWFLPVLFLSKLYLLQLLRYKNYLFILILGALLSIWFVKKTGIIIPLGILQGLVCAVFIYVGSILHKYNLFSFKLSWLLLGVLWVGVLLSVRNVNLAVRINHYSMGLFTLIETCFISYLFCATCQKFDSLNYFNKFKEYLIWCGRYSLVILCIHSIEGRFHWFSLPHEYFIAEIIIRIGYISLLTWLCTKWKPTQWVFHIKK